MNKSTGPKQQLVGKVAQEYVEKYPHVPSLTLARKLHGENPEMYRNIEHARRIIRTYRGQSGKKDRRKYARFHNLYTDSGDNRRGCWGVPDTDAAPWEPYELVADEARILVLADMHAPYHAPEAIEAALTDGREMKTTHVIIDGDLLDLYQMSTFERDPRRRDPLSEMDVASQVLDSIADAMPKAKVIWKMSNHENRFARYMYRHAPELAGDDFTFSIRSYMNLDERGIVTVPHGIPIKVRELSILHGDEFGKWGASAVNPARGAFMKTLTSVMTAHSHRTSTHPEPDLYGKLMQCYSIGCLCQMHPEFAIINKWNHGWAKIILAPEHWTVQHRMMLKDGRVV